LFLDDENMDKLSFLEVIAAIAVFVSLLLAVFLLTVKTERKLENRLFAAFLMINSNKVYRLRF
jgi:hypothetical protein